MRKLNTPERIFNRLLMGMIYSAAFCFVYRWLGPYAALIMAGVAIGAINERLGEHVNAD